MRVRKQGATTTNYVVDVNRALPSLLFDGTAFYVYGLDLIARVQGSAPTYYHYDGLGSVRAVTDAAGNVVDKYDGACPERSRRDVFGAVRSQTGSAVNDFRYTGEQLDGESGYYFLRARYYDPAVGRFISRDPVPGSVAAPQTRNPYTYVGKAQ